MKKTVIFLLLFCVFCIKVDAKSYEKEEYENIITDNIYEQLDDQSFNFFQNNGIDVQNPDWVNNLTTPNVLSHIFKILSGGIKAPIKTGVLMAAVILLTAAFTTYFNAQRFNTAIYASAICLGALIANNIWQSITVAINAVKGCSLFMLSFVPVFAGLVAFSGKAVTATAMSALLLTAAEFVSFAASFVVLPIMGGYLSLSIASGVSPLIDNSGIVDGVKKLSTWILSLLGTLFVGVLGIQTAVNSAADGVAMRTAKFILGTSVPVAGAALSEAVSTVSASVGLLRSSVGIYGVVAIAIMLLPIALEIILWRCALMLNISLSELFSLNKTTSILKAVDSMLSVILAVLLTVGAVFIISLCIVVTAGKQ